MKVRDVMELPADDGCRRRVMVRQSADRARHDRDHAARKSWALVHTAAARNLGQMLNKICIKDDIGLVNIVRSRSRPTSCARSAPNMSSIPQRYLHGRSY
jgi:hypothetical protein